MQVFGESTEGCVSSAAMKVAWYAMLSLSADQKQTRGAWSGDEGLHLAANLTEITPIKAPII